MPSLSAGISGFVRPPLAEAALAEPEAFPSAGLAPAGSAELPCPVSPFQGAHAAPGSSLRVGPQLSSHQLKRLAKQVGCAMPSDACQGLHAPQEYPCMQSASVLHPGLGLMYTVCQMECLGDNAISADLRCWLLSRRA